MLTIFLGTSVLGPRKMYPSVIPPVKSVKASATLPPFKASYEPYSLQYKGYKVSNYQAKTIFKSMSKKVALCTTY